MTDDEFETLLVIAELSATNDVAVCPRCERAFHQMSLTCDIRSCFTMHVNDIANDADCGELRKGLRT